MTSSDGSVLLEQFCKNPWEFQRTFVTPLKNLPPFVATFVSSAGPFQAGSLVTDQIVFEPRELNELLSAQNLPLALNRGSCLLAAGRQEIEMLLISVLSEWIDFLFIPEPASIAMYADHDEFTTVYSHEPRNLDRLANALLDLGFKPEPQFTRQFQD